MHDPWALPRFFGDPWESPQHEGAAERAATPVGVPCIHCREPFIEGDRGVYVTVLHAAMPPFSTAEPAHRECFLRAILGGVAHFERRCLCFGGSDADDDDGLTYRESARRVWRAVKGEWP
jgi:hypothetical protein